MEQILTIEEERKHIADTIKNQAFSQIKYDDFHEKRYLFFSVCDFLDPQWDNIHWVLNAIVGESEQVRYNLEIAIDFPKGNQSGLSDFQLYLKNANGNSVNFSIGNLKFINEKVVLGATDIHEELAKLLTIRETKVSLQFENIKYIGESIGFGKKLKGSERIDLQFFTEMVSIYNENRAKIQTSRFSDTQIDEIYDFCLRIAAKQKREEKKIEKSRQVKQDKKKDDLVRYANNTLEREIAKKVNPYDFEIIDNLFSNQRKIPCVQALKDYCISNGIKSKNLVWITSLGENYDKESILKEVRSCKEEYEKKSSGFFAKMGLVGVSKVRKTYCDATMSFIEDFNNRFPKP